MKDAVRIMSRALLLVAMGISLSLLNKAEARATVISFSPAGGTYVEQQNVTLANNDRLTIRYYTGDSAPSDLNAGTIYTGAISVTSSTTIWAWAVDNNSITSVPESATYTITSTTDNHTGGGNNTTPPSTPPSDPPTPEEPLYEDTQAYFLDTVCNAVDDALGKLSDINITPQEIQDLKANGITIDAGVWESIDSNTCQKIDNLLAKGVPVRVNYLHKGKKKELFIPVDFGSKYKISDMCDFDPKVTDNTAGYVGFEYIFASVVAGKPIDKNQLPESSDNTPQTHSVVIASQAAMAVLRLGNDQVGAATEGLGLAGDVGADGVSSFARMGGGSMRQETG